MSTQKKCPHYVTCPMRTYYAEGKISKQWVDEYCFGDFEACVRKLLEDDGVYHSDQMMPDGKIDRRLQ